MRIGQLQDNAAGHPGSMMCVSIDTKSVCARVTGAPSALRLRRGAHPINRCIDLRSGLGVFVDARLIRHQRIIGLVQMGVPVDDEARLAEFSGTASNDVHVLGIFR
ncbi:hypothetical protein OKW49_007824 [Paraburkholderia youngii]|uniref:hypothetical protein n=1 Tax=Paraburkholderia youngii TaxID=2782701 RepID=UPI003D194EDB